MSCTHHPINMSINTHKRSLQTRFNARRNTPFKVCTYISFSTRVSTFLNTRMDTRVNASINSSRQDRHIPQNTHQHLMRQQPTAASCFAQPVPQLQQHITTRSHANHPPETPRVAHLVAQLQQHDCQVEGRQQPEGAGGAWLCCLGPKCALIFCTTMASCVIHGSRGISQSPARAYVGHRL